MIPKYLYHGTNAKHLPKILENGLLPTALSGSLGNWEETQPSHPYFVYLTDAYALYYAMQCAGDDPYLVLRIDTEKLLANNQIQWACDEDVLAQINPEHVSGDINALTEHYRDRLHLEYTGLTYAERSMILLGNCTVTSVPPEAIESYVSVEKDRGPALVMFGVDPQVSVHNYQFCGSYYRTLTSAMFDGYKDLLGWGEQFHKDVFQVTKVSEK